MAFLSLQTGWSAYLNQILWNVARVWAKYNLKGPKVQNIAWEEAIRCFPQSNTPHRAIPLPVGETGFRKPTYPQAAAETVEKQALKSGQPG